MSEAKAHEQDATWVRYRHRERRGSVDEKRLKGIGARVERVKGGVGPNLPFLPLWYQEDVADLLVYTEKLKDKIHELEDYNTDLEDDIQNMRD